MSQLVLNFGICTVVGLDGTLVEAIYAHQVSTVNMLASTRVPFRPMMVQMPNVALIDTMGITV